MHRIALAAAVLGAFVAVVAACADDPRYVYTARRYDSAKGCLDNYKGVETVPGEGVSVLCKQTCLAIEDTVYVSPVCPPFPDNTTEVDDTAPECQAALDASRLEASCAAPAEEEDPDGGEDEEDDAGSDEDADSGNAADAAEEG